jgi:hypothetical protein
MLQDADRLARVDRLVAAFVDAVDDIGHSILGRWWYPVDAAHARRRMIAALSAAIWPGDEMTEAGTAGDHGMSDVSDAERLARAERICEAMLTVARRDLAVIYGLEGRDVTYEEARDALLRMTATLSEALGRPA